MLLSDAKNEYIRFHKLKCSTPKTIKNYDEILSVFIRCVSDKDIKDFTIDDVIFYQEWLYEKGLSKSSKATYLRHIKAFIHYLEENNYLPPDSISNHIKLPSKSKRLVDLFTPDDVKNIINAIDLKTEWLKVRNICIFLLMYDSGLRQGEVTKLMLKDLMLDNKTIKVHGKGDKDRLVPLGNATILNIRLYLSLCPYTNEYVFCNLNGTQITTNTIKQFIYDLKIATGLDNLSSHKLRHNFATNYCIDSYCDNKDVDIYKLMVLLGHNDIRTTRIYLHIANEYIISSDFKSHFDKISNK